MQDKNKINIQNRMNFDLTEKTFIETNGDKKYNVYYKLIMLKNVRHKHSTLNIGCKINFTS